MLVPTKTRRPWGRKIVTAIVWGRRGINFEWGEGVNPQKKKKSINWRGKVIPPTIHPTPIRRREMMKMTSPKNVE